MEQRYLTAKNFLYTILLNKDTETIADAYIVGYLKQHPHVLTQYFKEVTMTIYIVTIQLLDFGDFNPNCSVYMDKKEAIMSIVEDIVEKIDKFIEDEQEYDEFDDDFFLESINKYNEFEINDYQYKIEQSKLY